MAHEMAHERILSLLERAGVAWRVYVHEPVITLEQARARVPRLCENLLKTVVFRRVHGGWVLAAVEAPRRIQYRQLAEALGINRTQLRTVAPAEVEQGLGFPVGGVGPFPLAADTQVILDQAAAALPWIFCGSGRQDRTLRLTMADLLRASAARVYPITRADYD